MALRSRDIEFDTETADDAALVTRASRGDRQAFEALYRRHSDAAWRVGVAVAGSTDGAADAVSEAFTRLLVAVSAGKVDATVNFRPYLLATTRNAALDQHRYRARVHLEPAAETTEPPPTQPEPGEAVEDHQDATFALEAFRSLPERWRSVLWMTEVEGIPARDVGERLGLSANGAAQLAHRARTRLKERFAQAHLRHTPAPECVDTVAQLGAFVSGGLSAIAAADVQEHLSTCEACRRRAEELQEDVGGMLRWLALPIPIGLAGAALDTFHSVFPVANTAGKSALAKGWATRGVAMSSAAVLTLAVISAGLMSGPKNTPVPGSNTGGAVAAPATNVTPLPDGTTILPGQAFSVSAGHSQASAHLAIEAPTATPSTISVAPSSPSAHTGSTPASSKPTTAASSNGLGVQVGANLEALSASASVELLGGCTGISLNGSASCAPKAPSSPGLSLTLTTPVGSVSF